MLFKDRTDAGKQLAETLKERYASQQDLVVLALPRGGVPVAFEVARALHAPLGLFLVRKLGVPGYEETAMGAIASGGVQVLNQELVQRLGIGQATIAAVARKEQQELARRERAYRGDEAPPAVQGKTVLLVDDGLATGATMWAAVVALRQQGPARIVVAVPTAAPETCDTFRALVDEIICAATPRPFLGVGRWYGDFSQTSDEQVRQLLRQARTELPPLPRGEAQHF